MKITIIRPNMFNTKSKDAMQPLAVSILSGLTPEDVEIEFFDDRVEDIPDGFSTDLVAISIETFTARRAYQISAKIRKTGIPVIMGGVHPTFLCKEALMFCDSVIVGEAEGIWEQVIEDFKRGALRKIYSSDTRPSLTNLNFDRSIFKDKKYAPLIPVQFGRGCKNSCEFCSVSAFFGCSLRQRPVQEVVNEIFHIHKKNIFFVDDNIFIDKENTKSFLKALVPLKIKWSSQASIDIVNHPEILQLMKDSGCTSLIIGFETMDKENLRLMGKNVNINNINYKEAIKKLSEYGIMVYGTFVIGYDYDTKDTFKSLLEFAIENKLMLANFNPLLPMPGTRLYKRFQKEGRLIYNRWWLDPLYRYGESVINPKGMTAVELSEGCFNARIEFNKYSSIFNRLMKSENNFSSLYNAGIFLAANFISRNEIYEKQGARLGDDTDLIFNDEVIL